MPKADNCCFKCQERILNCHSYCVNYKAYRDKIYNLKVIKEKEKLLYARSSMSFNYEFKGRVL